MSLASQALRLCVQAISEPGQISKDGERVLFFMGYWEYLINITQKLRYCLFCLVTVFLIMVWEHGAKGSFSKGLLGVCFGWTCNNCIWTIWNLECRGFSAYGWLAKPPLMGKHLEHVADFCNVAPRLKIVSDSFSPSLKAAAKRKDVVVPCPHHLLSAASLLSHLWAGDSVSQQPHLCFQLAADSPFWEKGFKF